MARLAGPRNSGRPDDRAGLFFESDHRGLVRPRAAHDLVAVDQGRFAVAAVTGPFALELFFQILLPDDFSLGRVETDEPAAEAEGVDLVAVDGGRAVRLIGPGVDARFPEQLAGLPRREQKTKQLRSLQPMV